MNRKYTVLIAILLLSFALLVIAVISNTHHSRTGYYQITTPSAVLVEVEPTPLYRSKSNCVINGGCVVEAKVTE